MEIFLMSFGVYLITALAFGIGYIVRGRNMHAGCRGITEVSNCKYESLCGGACRRKTDV
jgi:hypothetical protein